MENYTVAECARLIDHTNLKAEASTDDMVLLCEQATENHFKMVAINQVQTARCHQFLKGTDVHVGAAIAFPLGQTTIAAKVFETEDAIKNGADEIDYVINLTEVKDGNFAYIEEEMQKITSLCKAHDVIIKVIFENAYLTEAEIIKLAEIAKKVQPDFIKTSTGMAASGAKVADVALMKKVVGDTVKVKAAGGIRDAQTFKAMIQAGAERIGTSAGIQILHELREELKQTQQTKIEISKNMD